MAAVKNLMVRCGADFSGLISASNKAASSMAGMQAQAGKMQGTFSKVQQSSGAVQSGFGGMQKASSGLSAALSKLGKIAAAALSIRALVNFGKSAVEVGSSVAEVQNVVDTAFGDMAYKMDGFAKTSIEQFGMSKLSAKQTASTYMAMAKGMGLAADEASDMALSLTGLTGDVASFYNISQELADTKLKSVFTGETETLKDLGIVMTQANLDAFAMANGFGKTTASMTQAEKVQLRYAFVTQQLSLEQGDFAKTSHSWANQTRILSERWKEFMSICGQMLIKVLTPMLEVLNQITQTLINMANSAAAMLGVDLSGSAGSAIQSIANSSEYASEAMEDATESAEALKKTTAGFDELNILSSGQTVSSGGGAESGGLNIPAASVGDFNEPDTSGISRAAEKVKGIFESLKTYITTRFAPTISSWGAAFSKLKAPVKEALTNVGTSISTLRTESIAPFSDYLTADFIPGVANAFSETFAPIFEETMPVLFDEFSNDFDYACGKVSSITADILQPAFMQTKVVATDAFSGISKAWDEHGAGILEKFQTFKQSLRDIWDEIYGSIIKPVVDNIGGKLTNLWNEHLKPLWNNLSSFFGSLAEFLLTIWNQVLKPLVSYVIAWVAPKIQRAIESIWSVISTVWGMLSDVIGGILKALGGLMDFITGVFTGNWNKAWNGIKDFFVGIWDAIWGTVKGIINLIIDGINMLWNGIYSAVKGIVDGVGGIAGAIGNLFGKDWKFNMPDKPPLIPKLATGGIVDRATAAVIGESGREAVLPLENNTGWMDALADRIAARRDRQGTQTRVVLQVNGKTLAESVIRSINELTRQTGETPLVLV